MTDEPRSLSEGACVAMLGEKFTLDIRPTFVDEMEKEYVLLKVVALNHFYSTNIFNVYAVSKHIVGIRDFDARFVAVHRHLADDYETIPLVPAYGSSLRSGDMLKDLLKCGYCGCAMIPTYSSKNVLGRGTFHYYRCNNTAKYGILLIK